MYSIGQLARRTGVKIPTIRYYEETGLIDEPGRSAGNQRRYGSADLERLSFIRHARELGLTIESIRQLIELAGHPEKPCTTADTIVKDRLADVRARIERLKRLESELQRMASSHQHGTVEQCYILRALGDHDLCAAAH